MLVRSVCTDIAGVVFPTLCRGCGGLVEGGVWAPLLCRRCGRRFSRHEAPVAAPPPLSAAFALSRFEGVARRLLIDLKYDGLLRAGVVIGRRMAQCAKADAILAGAHFVVPVPLHWLRRWRRGHNQAAVLARSLCVATHRDLLCVAALRRRRRTAAQVGLGRSQRRHNVRDAFAVRRCHRTSLRGQTVVLVDDVITTGATAAAAAATLRRAGATDVRMFAAAWAPLGRPRARSRDPSRYPR